MSDFGRPDADSPNRGDLGRYAWLLVLGTLVLVIVLAPVDGGLAILLAVYLLVLAAVGVIVLVRRRRRP